MFVWKLSKKKSHTLLLPDTFLEKAELQEMKHFFLLPGHFFRDYHRPREAWLQSASVKVSVLSLRIYKRKPKKKTEEKTHKEDNQKN